jgi:hypothetical protein
VYSDVLLALFHRRVDGFDVGTPVGARTPLGRRRIARCAHGLETLSRAHAGVGKQLSVRNQALFGDTSELRNRH